MKKDNKQKTGDSPTSTIPPKTNVHSAGTKTQKEDTKVEKPSLEAKIAIVGVIVALIIGVPQLYFNWSEKKLGKKELKINEREIDSIKNEREIDSITKCINNSIVKICESFEPYDIEIDSLSSPDFQLVKDFQNVAIRLATEWKSMNTSRSISESLDLYGLIGIADSQLEDRENFNKERDAIMACIDNILNYGNQNDIRYYKPQKDKMMNLRILESKRDDNIPSERAKIKWIKMILDCNKDSKNSDKDWIIDELKSHENTYKSKNNLEYTDALFETIIELNERYMIHIKQMG